MKNCGKSTDRNATTHTTEVIADAGGRSLMTNKSRQGRNFFCTQNWVRIILSRGGKSRRVKRTPGIKMPSVFMLSL